MNLKRTSKAKGKGEVRAKKPPHHPGWLSRLYHLIKERDNFGEPVCQHLEFKGVSEHQSFFGGAISILFYSLTFTFFVWRI